MANGFQGPPAVDFYSQLSGMADTIQLNNQLRQARETRDAAEARQLLRDQTSDSHWDQSHKLAVDTAANAESRWRMSHELAKRAANRADEDRYVIKEITDPDTGQTSFVRLKTTGAEGPIGGGGAPGPAREPNNPFASSTAGKTTGEQDKAAGFSDRMLASEGILSGEALPANKHGPMAPGIDREGASLESAAAGALGKFPGVGGVASKYLTSDAKKSYDAAKMNFITAQLRRESGAVISPSEFETEDKKYFPQIYDPEPIVQQKRAARRIAIEAMAREGGRTYRPKYNFNADGRITPRAIRISSEQQYNALPPGTIFIAPDGSERTKP